MIGKNVEVRDKYVVRKRVGYDRSHDGLVNLDNNTAITTVSIRRVPIYWHKIVTTDTETKYYQIIALQTWHFCFTLHFQPIQMRTQQDSYSFHNQQNNDRF